MQLCRYVKGPDFPDRRPDPQLRRGAEGDLQDRLGHRAPACDLGGGAVDSRGGADALRHQHSVHGRTRPRSSSASPTSCCRASCRRSLDVKDVSTDDVRIALEMKKDADPRMVMAYLFKNTPLQTNFIVNLTCLIPTENAEVGRPERLDLHAILWHFLHFRLEVVTKPARARARGAAGSASTSSRASRRSSTRSTRSSSIIRKSEGKADAAEKIMKRFGLDAEQADAILELKLYRLARLEILVIQNELADKRKRARQISGLLKDEEARWKRRPRRDRGDPENSLRRQAPHAASRPPKKSPSPPTTSSSRRTTSSSCRATVG